MPIGGRLTGRTTHLEEMKDIASGEIPLGPSVSTRWPLTGRQWQGARPYQEDAFGVLEVDMAGRREAPALLVILADGMGGAAGGATASRTAVEVFAREFPMLSGTAGARLRYAGHPAWRRNHQCTNIQTGPVDGGRSA